MDNDDTRRGKPTAHKVFGEATAILAGDALLTKAFEIMAADIFTEFSPAKVLAARNIAQAAGAEGMVGGQVLDIAGSPDVVEMERKKTGELFRVCLETGALIGGADNVYEVDALGRDLGLAFQIKDDIADFGEDKVTYVSKYGLERSKKDFNNLREKILRAGLFGGSPAAELVAKVLGDAFEEN
jgi:geranylgeranyl diphosphate synthase type II